MDLHEEYLSRRKVPAFFIKYPEKANLILRSKDNAKVDWNCLHVSITFRQEPNHPAQFQFTLTANPIINATPDFSHFSYHNSKVLIDEMWEWDQYEEKIKTWSEKYSHNYEAVPSVEAIFVSWEMFLSNYDMWFANFLPYRVIDLLAASLGDDNVDRRLESITAIENWIKDKHERVYMCWRNIRQTLDQSNYADWLAKMISG